MPRGRGHRAALEEIGTELNLVPYLDMMTVLVLFLMLTITSFLSYTMLDASIPTISPEAEKQMQKKKEKLLLMVRVTNSGFLVDPNVEGGPGMKQVSISKKNGEYDFARLTDVVSNIKTRFKDETRVLIISEPKIVYDNIIQSMD